MCLSLSPSTQADRLDGNDEFSSVAKMINYLFSRISVIWFAIFNLLVMEIPKSDILLLLSLPPPLLDVGDSGLVFPHNILMEIFVLEYSGM